MAKKVILIQLKVSNAICWPLLQKGAGLICFDFGRILGSYWWSTELAESKQKQIRKLNFLQHYWLFRGWHLMAETERRIFCRGPCEAPFRLGLVDSIETHGSLNCKIKKCIFFAPYIKPLSLCFTLPAHFQLITINIRVIIVQNDGRHQIRHMFFDISIFFGQF